MTEWDAEIAILHERIKQLTEKVDEMRGDVNDMKKMAERYRGGFIVVAALGGIVGLVVQAWEFIKWHLAPGS